MADQKVEPEVSAHYLFYFIELTCIFVKGLTVRLIFASIRAQMGLSYISTQVCACELTISTGSDA